MRGIERSFGSFDAFKTRFVDTAMKRFGSGWAWLSLNAEGKLDIHSRPTRIPPLLFNLTPVFGVDVWEHAYYLHYENRRWTILMPSGMWQIGLRRRHSIPKRFLRAHSKAGDLGTKKGGMENMPPLG